MAPYFSSVIGQMKTNYANLYLRQCPITSLARILRSGWKNCYNVGRGMLVCPPNISERIVSCVGRFVNTQQPESTIVGECED